MLPSDLIADIRFPSVIIVSGERALVHYDLFAISRVLGILLNPSTCSELNRPSLPQITVQIFQPQSSRLSERSDAGIDLFFRVICISQG